MKITVLSDNQSLDPRLVAKHSLSVLVEVGFEKILFDAGIDFYTLEHNTRVLDVDLSTVDYVVISHEHVPHYGGYRFIAQEAPYVPTLIPYGTSEYLGLELRQHGLKPVEVTKWVELRSDVVVSPPFYGPPYEHFLVVNHAKGLVIFTGCTHPGLQALEQVVVKLGGELYAVIGGFHLQNAPLSYIEYFAKDFAEKLRPKLVVPLHCSGKVFARKLKEYGVEVVEGGAGLKLEL